MDPNGLDEFEDDTKRFREAREGDHFMCPFQCDDCMFFNMKGRYQREGSKEDELLATCVRRAILDAFWARERSTVEKNGEKCEIYGRRRT